MYHLTSKLMIYRDIGDDSILFKLADIFKRFDAKSDSKEVLISDIYGQIHRLLDVATRYGFDKNLWHNYLAYLLATTETPFTLVSEKNGVPDTTIRRFALNDFAIFKKLFDFNFAPIEDALSIDCFAVIENFHAVGKAERIYNKNVSDKVRKLSDAIEKTEDAEAMANVLSDFYAAYGVGKFGLNAAFRIGEDPERELLIPITNVSPVQLSDLVGYETQKKQLVDNTEAFVAGRQANNVLLYGDAGTGKSTSIKAILNQYYPQGLRMIEIYKHQFRELSKIIATIKNRNYRFIIYMDDLSFEESELEYKYLKAIIEGGLEPRPENVLIYATSNRRHLVRETFKDRQDQDDEDIHRNDTVQEKLSLANRFGISIGYFRPSPKEYLNIVKTLAARYPQIQISDEELRLQANRWEMKHGGFSGRTAQQFVDYLAGTAYKSED